MAEADRTCVGCGAIEEQEDLLRLALAPEGSVVVDLRARLPGRGAWVHAGCVSRVQPGRLKRAFRGEVSGLGLMDAVRDALIRSVLDGLSLAASAGALVGGHDLLEVALREGRISELVVASDAAERTLADLMRVAGDVPVTRLPLGKEILGTRLGAGARAAVGLVDASSFRHLREQLRRLRGLG